MNAKKGTRRQPAQARASSEPPYNHAAGEAARFIDKVKGVPEWLYDAMLRVLELATEKTGVAHYDMSARGFDLKGLSKLFTLTSGLSLSELLDGYDLASVFIHASPKEADPEPTDEDRNDLAEFLSAAMKHRAMPAELREAIKEGMNEAFGHVANEAMQEEGYIVAHLEVAARRERKGGARR